MNLYALLQKRQAAGRPVRVALIGAGKFGSMYLAQARRTVGVQVATIADLAPERARASLARVGWTGPMPKIIEDSMQAIADPSIEVVIDATGHPAAGIAHVLACCEHRKHIVMVNVEADALAGPLLAKRAKAAGIVYSLAYGDQPALICELVDWARAAGFRVVAAGKGTKYLPAYHASTPQTVWGHYGFSDEMVAKGDFNAQMFNSFLDGTKSGIEMTAVANATGLTPAPEGLAFPPCGVDDLPRILCPREAGGTLHHAGQVEVISSLERDGKAVFRDLRWGVYVTFAAEHEYVRRCFNEYGIVTDASGEYAAMYKPSHLIGLELGISVASVAVRGEATGAATGWRGDCVATAKRALRTGEVLDGEGGYTVWGKLMSAKDSAAKKALPIGLAHKVKLTRDVPEGATLSWDDVEHDADSQVVRIRREMEKTCAPQ
jgi:predicted homoserine dehydrogenase-like protein